MKPRKGLITRNTRVKYQSSSTPCLKVISNVKVFKKMGQTPRSQGQKYWYPWKGLITGNVHVKYQSSSTHCSKVISKVKVSERRTE